MNSSKKKQAVTSKKPTRKPSALNGMDISAPGLSSQIGMGLRLPATLQYGADCMLPVYLRHFIMLSGIAELKK